VSFKKRGTDRELHSKDAQQRLDSKDSIAKAAKKLCVGVEATSSNRDEKKQKLKKQRHCLTQIEV
jgi:hypothetical protein